MPQICKICKKICKICHIKKHFKFILCKICNKYAKYVSQNVICRICTPHFADVRYRITSISEPDIEGWTFDIEGWTVTFDIEGWTFDIEVSSISKVYVNFKFDIEANTSIISNLKIVYSISKQPSILPQAASGGGKVPDVMRLTIPDVQENEQ